MAQDDKDRRTEVALRHAGVVLAGYMALGALARGAGSMLDTQSEKKRIKKLKAYANARYPVYSPDLDLGDAADETRQRRLGLAKTAEGDRHKAMDALTIMPNMKHPLDLSGFLSGLGDSRYHWSHPALGATAAIAGSAIGWKLAGKLASVRANKRLDKRIAQARNEMDRLVAQEYARTRGKEASRWLESTFSGTSKIYWIYALLAGLGAAVAGKKYMDDRDPARARLKAIKRYAAEKSVVKDAPVFLGAWPTETKPKPAIMDVAGAQPGDEIDA
jgi:uncharacterized small protein (DUF1192 family)